MAKRKTKSEDELLVERKLVKCDNIFKTCAKPPEFSVHLLCEKDWVHKSNNNLNLSSVILYKTRAERRYIFNQLEKEITYFTDPQLTRIKVFSKWYDIPRKQSAYGDQGITYKYSNIDVPAIPWPQAPVLQEIRSHIEQCTGISYNFVLINRYADGKDKMGEHKDDEKELDPGVPIASLSLGQERDFVFKHEDLVRKRESAKCEASNKLLTYKMLLRNGMLLLMRPPTNRYWYHALPARSINTCPGVRINLTFRKIV